MEAKSKGECIELAIDSLMQLQEHYVEAVDWIEKARLSYLTSPRPYRS